MFSGGLYDLLKVVVAQPLDQYVNVNHATSRTPAQLLEQSFNPSCQQDATAPCLPVLSGPERADELDTTHHCNKVAWDALPVAPGAAPLGQVRAGSSGALWTCFVYLPADSGPQSGRRAPELLRKSGLLVGEEGFEPPTNAV